VPPAQHQVLKRSKSGLLLSDTEKFMALFRNMAHLTAPHST
jgi:hypothetical protein